MIGDFLITIPYHHNGIFVSGGADSAILLYILMRYNKNPLRVYTISNLQRWGTQASVASNIILECIKLTGNTNITHHISYTNDFTNEYMQEKLLEPVNNGEVNCIFTGTTALPPMDSYVNFTHRADSYSEIERVSEKFKNTSYKNGKLLVPFFNLDKRSIASLYKHYNLTETLFTLTRSCFVNEHAHCGSCFWCEERFWAFGKL